MAPIPICGAGLTATATMPLRRSQRRAQRMAANVEGWRPPTEPPAVRSVPWAPIELAPIELAPVRDLKRVLLRYVWTICFRELMRARAIPAEVRVGVLFLAGLLMVPFMLASYISRLSGSQAAARVDGDEAGVICGSVVTAGACPQYSWRISSRRRLASMSV